MEQMRHDMEQITKEKETLEKGLEDYRQTISEREAEIGHLTKRIKNKDSKIFKLKTDYDKSTAHYFSKLKKKDLRIGEINNELAERNNELEETIVKFEKMKQTQYNSEELYLLLLVPSAVKTVLSISQNGINQITVNKQLSNQLNK
jgi:chromosome segregation ATPase